MGRKVLGLIAGFVLGFVVVSLLQMISSAMYPLPEGTRMDDMEAMRAFVASLPAGAFLIVLVSHAVGAFTAAFTCAAVLRKKWLTGTVILGGLLLLAGIANLVMIPHPIWFAILDLLAYLPAAFAGAILAERTFLPGNGMSHIYESTIDPSRN